HRTERILRTRGMNPDRGRPRGADPRTGPAGTEPGLRDAEPDPESTPAPGRVRPGRPLAPTRWRRACVRPALAGRWRTAADKQEVTGDGWQAQRPAGGVPDRHRRRRTDRVDATVGDRDGRGRAAQPDL